ncbi:radical SAM protein [Candidatus Woesearchaeota archaeon]|nr:radical SAM protein [Candidatus Woesearchaeota archaeon]
MKKWNNLEELAEWETRIIEQNIDSDIKPLLLCFGLSDSSLTRELVKIVNPSGAKRTGNVGIPLRLGSGSIINAVTAVAYDGSSEDFTYASPLKLEGSIEDIGIYFQGKELEKASLIQPGKWVDGITKRGKPFSSVMLPEAGNFLMSAIPYLCSYREKGNPCLFCEYTNGLDKTVDDFVEAAVSAFKENPCYSLTLTGGNAETEDRGLKRYAPFVREISKAVKEAVGRKPAIQLEVSPPNGNAEKYIDELAEAGATSFMMNLEQGKYEYRKIVCAEKSKIPLSDYARAFKVVKEKGLGAASVLINGLAEPPNSTFGYAKMLISMGVRPIVLPLRPRGKLRNAYPANPVEFAELSKKVGELIDKSSIELEKTQGCASCPGCAMVQEDMGYKL